MAAYDQGARPRIGDWIRFADGTELRIGILYPDARGDHWTLP
jgi:hypothetical protein